jgi:hypothetical protein
MVIFHSYVNVYQRVLQRWKGLYENSWVTWVTCLLALGQSYPFGAHSIIGTICLDTGCFTWRWKLCVYIYRDMKPLARLHSQRYQRHGWNHYQNPGFQVGFLWHGMEQANKIWLFMALMAKTSALCRRWRIWLRSQILETDRWSPTGSNLRVRAWK